MSSSSSTTSAHRIAERVANFVRTVVVEYEQDLRWGPHGPTDELVNELKERARTAGVMNPHVAADGNYLSHKDTAVVLRAAGLSPLGPVAVNAAAPDEGNMYLLYRIGTPEQKARFLRPLLEGRTRSAFLMTEPASEGGAGSDPSMLQTVASIEGDGWRITGRKAFITGAEGASVGIVMAKTDAGATLFVVPLPDPAVRIERIVSTLDGSMPGGHAIVSLEGLQVSAEQVLGQVNRGFENAQVRLAPARLTHCMRWLGAATRANEIAIQYAISRHAFGKALIDHEGIGFMLADNLIDLKQSELMIDWCAGVLDSGELGTAESSLTKVAVSEALYRVADRCVQVMGAIGVSADTIVSRVFSEIRGFRIYDGPTEVHKWYLAKKIKRDAAT
jgi:acyl-CoA dehydrogenase